MKKIYCLLFAMLPLAAMAGEVKVTKPALTLENDTLTLDFKFNMEAVKVNSTQLQDLAARCCDRKEQVQDASQRP